MSEKEKKAAEAAIKALEKAALALSEWNRARVEPGYAKDDNVFVLKMDMLEYASFLENKYGNT